MGDQLNPAAERKARKPHDCIWCHTAIEKGEIHTWWVWADDGTLTTVRMHNECFKAMDRENDDYYDEYICEDYHRRGMTHDESFEAKAKEDQAK